MSSNDTCDTEDVVESSNFLKAVSIFSIALMFSSFLVLLTLFCWRRKSSALLTSRANPLTYTVLFGCLVQSSWAIDSFMDRTGFPCLIINNLLYAVATLQIAPRAIATIQVYFQLMLNGQLAKFELISAVKMRGYDKLQMDEFGELPNAADDLASKAGEYEKSFFCWILCCGFAVDAFFGKTRAELAVRDAIMVANRLPGASVSPDLEVSMEQFPPQYVVFLSSKKFAIFLQTILILVGLISFLIRAANEAGCTSPCADELQLLNDTFAMIGIVGVLSSYYLYKVRREPDPLGILGELRWSSVLGLASGLIIMILIKTDPANVEEGGKFRWAILLVFASWLQLIVVLGYPLYLSEKHDKDPLKQRNSISLGKVLESEAGRDQFKAFLVGELSVENYLFWRSATKYKDHFDERDSAENRTLRTLITKMYVLEEAALCVNISGSSRQNVKDSLENEPDPDDFKAAITDAVSNMEGDSFIRFRKTSEFRRLFSETKDEEIL